MYTTPSPETLDFIRRHRTDDVNALALRAAHYPGIDFPFALRQIAGWQTACRKLPRWSATEGLLYPPHLSLEQCSSEATARFKAGVLGGGDSMADLTGGMGVDCSYVARNYNHAAYVERNAELCALAAHNFPLLDCAHVQVYCAEAEDYLNRMEPVDLIYLDPARRDAHGGRTVAIADCAPDVASLLPRLMQKAQCVAVKLSPMLDIAQALQALPTVGQVFVISVQGECKELLLLLSPSAQSAHAVFHCIDLRGSVSRFSFTADEERRAVCPFASSLRTYLYEPNASLLKAGAFRLPAERAGLEKLHPNSHLYTSDAFLPGFPGRVFAIEGVCGFGKRELKALTADLEQANLTVRNFPATVAELRKRLRLREGGSTYLFATTLADGRKVLLKCIKAPNSSPETCDE